MVKIRLKRLGAKKKPFYRIVVMNSRDKRDGRAIEELGYYNPLLEGENFKVNVEGAKKWLKNGAQPTQTVKNILTKAGVYN